MAARATCPACMWNELYQRPARARSEAKAHRCAPDRLPRPPSRQLRRRAADGARHSR
jgi:hypothetical protein